MAKLPVDELAITHAFGPHLSVTARAAGDRGRPRQAGEDALLLLRPAVRHPAQGARQRGDRLRAVGGVSVQPRHAVPQGREALPPGRASGSPRDRVAPRSVGSGWLPRDAVRRRHPPRGRRDRSTASATRQRVDRPARRREPHDREDLSARQVRPRLPEDAVHRLQRPALHGERRRGEQEGVRHRSCGQPVGRHPRQPRWSGSPGRTSPSVRRSRRTTSGRRASAARR